MWINCKDKVGIINVKLKVDGRVKLIFIIVWVEEGRFIYLFDMSYYVGVIIWFINYIFEWVE